MTDQPGNFPIDAAKTPVSIIIPTYNGRDILEECLPSVAEEIERRGGIDELFIIDNASTDGTVDFLSREYPSARVLRLEENAAIFALNRAARATTFKYVFFLNNDMLLNPGCITTLLEGFSDDGVFAVTGRVMQWDRSTVQAGRRRAAYSRGMFWYLSWPGPDAPGHTLYALGGQSVFDREKFLTLGGLDTLFSPFYHEDLDVSYRAWRRGWRVEYKPTAVMIHRGATTAGRMYTRKQLDAFMQKNMLLFIWKNLHDPGLVREHLQWLPARAAAAVVRGDTVFLRGLMSAAAQLPAALKSRKTATLFTKRTDPEVLAMLRPEPPPK